MAAVDTTVVSADACRVLCQATLGCKVWTFSGNERTCRGMSTLTESPTLAENVPNTTTGGRDCNGKYLPFPDSLVTHDVLDPGDPCYKAGFLYGDCGIESNSDGTATLLAVHTTQFLLDVGSNHGWWDESIVSTVVTGTAPYMAARDCAKACSAITSPIPCGGFTMVFGICFLRSNLPSGLGGGEPISFCRATNPLTKKNAISGPPFHVSQAMSCSPEARYLPEWFEKCDVPRCTSLDEVNADGAWDTWEVETPPFPDSTRNLAYRPKDGTCFYPIYNRTEMREGLLQSDGGTWVMVCGGSNSFGMGATWIKAVHNNDWVIPTAGHGISKAESSTQSSWRANVIVDTVRHADGTSTVRKVTVGQSVSVFGVDLCGGNPWSTATLTKLQTFFEETEALHTPGSIRVTHICIYYFKAFAQFLNLAGRPNLPWKKLLAYSHSAQRYGGPEAMTADLLLVKAEEVCSRKGNVCVVGSRLMGSPTPPNPAWNVPHKNAVAGSDIHFMDYNQLAMPIFHSINYNVVGMDGGRFEVQGSHGIQSIYMYILHLCLNLFDLENLGDDSHQLAITKRGCPEALQLDKECTSASSEKSWNKHNFNLCNFKRDDITPMFGLSAYQVTRQVAATITDDGGQEKDGGLLLLSNSTNSTANATSINSTKGRAGGDVDGGGGENKECSFRLDVYQGIVEYEEEEERKQHENEDGRNGTTGGTSNEGQGNLFNTSKDGTTDNGSNKNEEDKEKEKKKKKVTVVKKIKSLCGDRIWCGYEWEAWALGLATMFSVGLWYAFQSCWNILIPPPKKTRKKKSNKKLGAASSKSSRSKRSKRMSLDPGNGGRRSVMFARPDLVLGAGSTSSSAGPRGSERYVSTTPTVATATSLATTSSSSLSNRTNRTKRRRSVVAAAASNLTSLVLNEGSKKKSNIKGSTRLLSTCHGERLTSLTGARFLASMHIVAGHLYQKSAVGPMYFLGWGFTWVPWFFMLSGYVLMHARILSRTPDRVDTPQAALWKRSSTIFPMYAIGVILDMIAFVARGSRLPAYHILISQSFMLQSWISYLTENALQNHCWFLSAMVVYWLFFGPFYRFIRRLSLPLTLLMMFMLASLPYLSIGVPSAVNGTDVDFYKTHRHGKSDDFIDHLVITLKFNPLSYVHVFLFGMCLSRFRNHITRREDSYETSNSPRPLLQSLLMVPFRLGATLGYSALIASFLILKEAGAAKVKISARVGIFMPFQGLILLGLCPLRGRQVQGAKWQWGADPLANFFSHVPGWVGDVSYSQYILQILGTSMFILLLSASACVKALFFYIFLNNKVSLTFFFFFF